MVKTVNIFFVVVLGILFSCSSNEKETPGGLKFKVVKKGDGVLPKTGEVVVFQFIFIDSKDSVWADTKGEMPAAVLTNDSLAMDTEDGLTQMFRMVSKGDSIVVSMPITKFFNDIVQSPIPFGVDSTLRLTYRIRIDTILSQNDFMTYQMELMNSLNAVQLDKDIALIDGYLAERGIDAVKLESGLRYVITQPGTGENAKSGDVVKVNYTGYLLTGEYFDSSVQSVAEEKGLFNPMRNYEPYAVTIDQTGVIQGWHEALKYLNKGAKGTFYMPSTLAYGRRRASEVIAENSILVFDLEVTGIE
jgi:FKBP-type peptidyl-prolyl cis-trans isomerase FkpA